MLQNEFLFSKIGFDTAGTSSDKFALRLQLASPGFGFDSVVGYERSTTTPRGCSS